MLNCHELRLFDVELKNYDKDDTSSQENPKDNKRNDKSTAYTLRQEN